MTQEDPNLVEELSKMEEEPLMPIEKKLIVYSLGLGVVPLGLFYWISTAFFTAHP